MKKKLYREPDLGALGKGGRFAESLPDLALGKVASPLKRFGAAPQAARTVSATAPPPPQPATPGRARCRRRSARASPPPQPTSTYTPSVRSFLTAIDRSFLLPSRNSCLFSFPAAQNLPPRKSSRSHLCHHPPFRQVARQASVLILSASYFLL